MIRGDDYGVNVLDGAGPDPAPKPMAAFLLALARLTAPPPKRNE